MSLVDEIKSEIDPQGWNARNEFDELLESNHPLVWKPRKKDGKLRLSWSLLKAGLHCPRSATWTVHPDRFGINPDALQFTDSLASLRGNFAQTFLEHIYTHNFLALAPEKFNMALQASWRWSIQFYNPLKSIEPTELRGMRDEILKTLPKMLATLNREGFWADHVRHREVEKPLWWDMPSLPGVRLTGKADFLFTAPDKRWLVDGKWTSNPSTLDARQLTFYSILIHNREGVLPNRALFWCYPQDLIIDNSAEILSPQTIQAVLQDATKVAQQILTFDTTANPSPYNCKWCSHREHCDAVAN